MAPHQARLLLWNLADQLGQVSRALEAEGVPPDEAAQLGRAAATLREALRQARERTAAGAEA